MLRLKPDIQAT